MEVTPRTRRRPAPRGLRATFTIIIVIAWCVIGLLTVAAFALSARGLMTVFATRFARTEAELERNRILSRIDREVALSLKLADDPVVKRWVMAEGDGRLRALALDELESYRRAFTDHSWFLAPLASRHYYIRTATAAPGSLQITTLDPAAPADAWYFATIRDVESFALNVDYDRLIRATKVWINVIMRDEAGAKIALCGTGFDISDFLKTVVRNPDTNSTTILVDEQGVIQAHPNEEYVRRNAEAGQGKAKLTIYDLVTRPDDGRRLRAVLNELADPRVDVESLPLAVEGRPYLAAVSSMPAIGWYNIVLVDTTRVMRVQDFIPLAATLVVSLLLVLLAIALLVGRTVVRPLTALAAASGEIAAGRYGVQLPVTRGDEIGQLTRAFNAMSATVKETTEGLETRVAERTRELSESNASLRTTQAQIMESLDYARRVQAGILPGSAVLDDVLPERLVLSLPRDVVSGDFYHARRAGDHVVVVVIDCMGHGVPGAFMTMTVHAVLSHVLDAVCDDDPARIIAELDRELRETLHPRGSESGLDSGLDIALCVARPAAGKIDFAGAGLSLFVWNGARIAEVKGDTRRVGYRAPGTGSPWTNRTLQLVPRHAFYLTTDGFLDQAGGEKGFGYGRQRFAELVADRAALPMAEQERALGDALCGWQGARAQRDDITVLGFRAPEGGRG
ncbi:MAG TPA: SpoIIE family protein phosphatase [Spirochaetia bacterium]